MRDGRVEVRWAFIWELPHSNARYRLANLNKDLKKIILRKVEFVPGCRFDFIALRPKNPIQVPCIPTRSPPRPIAIDTVVSGGIIVTIFASYNGVSEVFVQWTEKRI
jgi:hypothetical protein